MSATPKPPVTKQIGSVQYRVRPLGAKLASRVLLLALRLMSRALQNAPKNDLGQVDRNAVMATAMGSISDEELAWLQSTLADVSDYSEDGGTKWPPLASHFELHFAANQFEMLQWLAFCFEVNFPDFFAKLGAMGLKMPSVPGLG